MTVDELAKVEKGTILESTDRQKHEVLYVRKSYEDRTRTLKVVFMGGGSVSKYNCKHWRVVE